MDFIIKNHHKSNYTVIYNNFIQDSDLTLELKGFGSYLLSRPSNWIINPHQLCSDLNIGKDKVIKLINSMIELGYMYKYKKNIAFTNKGELKNIYYFCDDKELLNKTTQPFRRDDTNFQLPLSETPLLELPVVEDPALENPLYNNTNYYKEGITKEDTNKKNTILTTNLSIRSYLKDKLDSATIVNLLLAKPDLTIEEFDVLHEKATLEFKNGYCNSINACIIKGAKGQWKFLSSSSNSCQDSKTYRILQSKMIYYLELFENSSFTPNEILSKFLKDSEKYDKDLVFSFHSKIKEKLESN